MPAVFLEGHDHRYPVSDLLRLFYGEASENENIISAGNDNLKIISRYDGISVSTCCGDVFYEKKVTGHEGNEIFPPKREIKLQLYRVLSELTGTSFPWGSLTGIRPTIVAAECGYDAKLLADMYFVEISKAKLASETAVTEHKLIGNMPSDKPHLYFSIPVCPSKCEYCSFPTSLYNSIENQLEGYVETMKEEIRYFSSSIGRDPGSIYVGGGTPTVLPDLLFEKLLFSIADGFDISHIPEFSVEAGRPETITLSKIKIMQKYGVTRVCVNPQTFNEETLMLIGRTHSSQDVFNAFRELRSAGFCAINMDLIAGLGKETTADFLRSLETAVNMKPENITLHSLSLKRTSIMKKRFSESPVINPVMDFISGAGDIAEMLKDGYNTLASNSYRPYYMYRQKYTPGGNENTGYSLAGHECLYNCAMMGDRHTVIGFGAKSITKKVKSAEGRSKIDRFHEPADIISYIRRSADIFRKKRDFLYESARDI